MLVVKDMFLSLSCLTKTGAPLDADEDDDVDRAKLCRAEPSREQRGAAAAVRMIGRVLGVLIFSTAIADVMLIGYRNLFCMNSKRITSVTSN